MKEDIKGFLEQAVNASYKGLVLKKYNFDAQEEFYEIHWTHEDGKRDISIGLRDVSRRRDFDVIPIQARNAPLGLIEIYTTFLQVLWFANDNDVTFETALLSLANDVSNEFEFDTDVDKTVH